MWRNLSCGEIYPHNRFAPHFSTTHFAPHLSCGELSVINLFLHFSCGETSPHENLRCGQISPHDRIFLHKHCLWCLWQISGMAVCYICLLEWIWLTPIPSLCQTNSVLHLNVQFAMCYICLLEWIWLAPIPSLYQTNSVLHLKVQFAMCYIWLRMKLTHSYSLFVPNQLCSALKCAICDVLHLA